MAAAARREVFWRALGTAVVVGSLLATINHGPDLLAGARSGSRLVQIGLTYLVPYCVSTYAAAMQELRHRHQGPESLRDRSVPSVRT